MLWLLTSLPTLSLLALLWAHWCFCYFLNMLHLSKFVLAIFSVWNVLSLDNCMAWYLTSFKHLLKIFPSDSSWISYLKLQQSFPALSCLTLSFLYLILNIIYQYIFYLVFLIIACPTEIKIPWRLRFFCLFLLYLWPQCQKLMLGT